MTQMGFEADGSRGCVDSALMASTSGTTHSPPVKEADGVNNGLDPEWLTPQRSPHMSCSSTGDPSGCYAALPGAASKRGETRVLESQGAELRFISREPVYWATVTKQSLNARHAHDYSEEHRG